MNPSDSSLLTSFYRVLAINEDREGVQFISSMEGIQYPVYAQQWHAEKVRRSNPFVLFTLQPQFEWTIDEDINHDASAIYAMQYFANFFVNECRKSLHSFPDQDTESKALIYNYSPVFTGINPDASFVQSYIF